jgi:superfamily II RNA helicase
MPAREPDDVLPFGAIPNPPPPRRARKHARPAPAPAPGRARAPAPAADERVTDWRGFRLLPFQIRAVEAVRAGRNVLVAAPTGAGKTLVAEYAMEDAVRRGLRCIYTSPIKALSSQKYRDFRDDPEVDVGIMTGDVTLAPHAQVLVMTTEILRNAIFENPALLRDVAYVIFDEVHYMDDRERGTVWEESLIFLPANVRLICLSATVSNVEEVGAWLAEIRPQEIEVIQEERRPVPLSHWMYTEQGGAFEPGKLDFHRKRAAEALERERRTKGGRVGAGGRRGRRGREGGQRRRDPGPDGRGLIDDLVADDKLPALVFSFSRKDVERQAYRNARRDLLDGPEHARMEQLQEELIELFQLGRGMLRGELFSMARGGVGYHHAGMLPIHKEVVERMFTAGLLKLLFTTETFALGINMPARSVVFQSLRKYDGVTFDWLRTRDYMQMAGRAGRQGIDEKGFVYSLLGPRELVEAPLKRLFAGRPEPVKSRFRLAYSTLLHLSELGRDRLYEAWTKSFAEYQGRARNKQERERQRRQQRRLIDRHLALLAELGYMEGEAVTGRGRIARLLSGYELQVTELLFRGALEHLPARALAMVFVALIHEERRRFGRPYVPARMFGDVRRSVSEVIGELCGLEARLGIEPESKRPDWGLTPAVMAWYGGCSIDELDEATEATPGDVCRVFRMAIQLMRNTRRAIDKDWDLTERLGEAIDAMNRDEIDARRQLELG